jgi:hypothetical protein
LSCDVCARAKHTRLPFLLNTFSFEYK